MVNVAHGEVYMISAYLAAISLALLAYFGIESFPLLMLGTLVFTIVVTGVYGWVIERVAYKPLRNSTRLAPLISAIGISLSCKTMPRSARAPANRVFRRCSPAPGASTSAQVSSSSPTPRCSFWSPHLSAWAC
jgi:branched-subunit amino acid ABC-type transport system permease component